MCLNSCQGADSKAQTTTASMQSDYKEHDSAIYVLFFFFLNFSRQGFSVFPWLSWNSLCRPGWPQTQKSACLCLPSARIKGVCHHCPAVLWFLIIPLFLLHRNLMGIATWILFMIRDFIGFEAVSKIPVQSGGCRGSQASAMSPGRPVGLTNSLPYASTL